MNRNNLILISIAIFLLIIGGIGFFGGFLCALGQAPFIEDSFELPLGDVQGIVVDNEGRIYLGLHFYSRIQIYDKGGKFLYGKFIDTSGGDFKMVMNENNILEIATARNDKLYTMNHEGSIIKEETNAESFFDFLKIRQSEYYDKSENIRYYIKNVGILPGVVKRYPTGKQEVVLVTPFSKWLFMGPFPAWIFWMFGVVILLFIGFKKDILKSRSEKSAQNLNPHSPPPIQ